jgi:hypothetical protein
VAAVLLAAATVGLFGVSRGKWSDPIIDSGREWIVPDALARGELLYRDVVYWFGPFTPYFHAAFFRVFGSNFKTLVLAGCCASAGVLVCLYFALRQVTDRGSSAAWTALAVPALVFMPDAGGSILGMGYRMWHAAAFGLLAVIIGARAARRGSLWAVFGSGIAAALSGLCRTEWGIAALLAAGIAVAHGARKAGRLGPFLSRLLAGFLLVFAGGIGFFVARAGLAAVVLDAPVLLFNLPEATRANVASLHASGWGRGAAQMVYGASIWVGVFWLIELMAIRRGPSNGQAVRLRGLGMLLLVLLVCGALGGLPYGPYFSGAPLLCAGAIWAGLRASGQATGAALAGFGTLGLLTSYRRPFFIADGPYVAAPLLFAFVCAAGWTSLRQEVHEPVARRRLSSFLLVGVVCLTAFAYAGRWIQYRSDERVPIAGTEGMLGARSETAVLVERIADQVRRATARGDGLVVFPEGELLNFLSGRGNPLRHKLYLPGYLTQENEPEIIGELTRHPPGAVVIWNRPMGEYGRSLFGLGTGRRVLSWLETTYRIEPFAIDPRHPSRVLLGFRKRN